jgi:hypothetical protein
MTSPEIVAHVRLFPTSEGGRAGPTPSDQFGCPLVVGDKMFDCRMLLSEVGPLYPGQSALVPIKFLSPDLAMPLLSIGSRFHIWDGKVVGEGEVKEISRR